MAISTGTTALRPSRVRHESTLWRTARRLPLYVLVIALSLIFMGPFFWTLASSLKAPQEIFVFPPKFFPAVPQWANYAEAMSVFPFGRWFTNSFQVVILNTVGVLLTASLVAYGFSRFEFRFRDVLFMLTLATIMLPAQVTLIPRFILFHKMKWIDTLLPLWVPAWLGGNAFAIFLMRQFMMTLPRELDEASIVDGATYFRVFWNIILPLCRPSLATLAIITFIANWSNFMEPLVYLNSSEKYTVAVGLRYFQANPAISGDRPMVHLLLAASVATIAPPVALFFAFQNQFVGSIAMTGLKG